MGPALKPLSPNDEVMAWPVGVRSNGMSSNPNQQWHGGFWLVQGNNHYDNIEFGG